MKLPKSIFKHTNHFFNEICKAEVLFILSLCCFPLYLFISSTKILWSIALAFFVLSLLRRGKIRILPSIIITAGIVALALLSPSGKILFSAGAVKITDGALNNGLHRSAVLCGMVFLSQFAVSPKLHFPGKIGFFFGQMFKYFDKLTAVHVSLKPGNIISSIDEHLIEIWNESGFDSAATEADEKKENADGVTCADCADGATCPDGAGGAVPETAGRGNAISKAVSSEAK